MIGYKRNLHRLCLVIWQIYILPYGVSVEEQQEHNNYKRPPVHVKFWNAYGKNNGASLIFWYSEDVSVKTNAKTNSHVGETGDNKQLIYLIVKLPLVNLITRIPPHDNSYK